MSRLCTLIWILLHSFGLSRPHSLGVRLVGLILILSNSLPHLRLRLRQLSFFSSAAIRHDVFHHLPFDSSSPRESSGSHTPATPPVSCLARHQLRLTFTLFYTVLHMLRADWRSWRFGQSSTALLSPLRALCVEAVDIMSSAFRLSLGVSLSWCASGTPHDRLLLDHRVPLRFTRSWCFLLRLRHHASCVHSESSVHNCHFG